jgi:rhodanese-related sulfurtransferase
MSNQSKSKLSKPSQPKWLLWASIVVIILAASGGYLIFRSRTEAGKPILSPTITLVPMPPEVSIDQAFGLYQQGAVILDIRTQAEWNVYHITNSISIPLADLDSRFGELPAGKNIVVVCFSPEQCVLGRDILIAAGLQSVTAMTQNIEGWVLKGYPFEGNFAN